eukprot:GEMP01047808.1.p1 GENE.GEMP01047808.1~~GEMP01047808.1.p1  ORF type:complete len:348 (+),score=47.43 GEMP01047808.1:177-1220(+)
MIRQSHANPRNVTDGTTKSMVTVAAGPVTTNADSDEITARNKRKTGALYSPGGGRITDMLKVPTKNTFINFPLPRSPSEDEFIFQINPSKSCPTSGLTLIHENPAAEKNATSEALQQAFSQTTLDAEPCIMGSAKHRKSAGTSTADTRSTNDSTFVVVFELLEEAHGRLGLSIDYSSGTDVRITGIDEGLVQEWNRIHANRGERLVRVGDTILSINDIRDPILMLAECSTAPEGELPQIVEVRILPGPLRDSMRGNPCNNGSKGHSEGLCRPCAYFHKPGGCDHEADCTYCHLCPPSELRRRKQVKLFFRKMMYNIQRRRSSTSSGSKLPLQAQRPTIPPVPATTKA